MRLMTEREAAGQLCCTVSAMRRWRRERRGPPFVRSGRLIRYRETDLLAFVERRRISRCCRRSPRRPV
ncbi:MAG: helix-turn-helix domain-containing protein [Acidobacteria bacterium]|nr:helix-turn-helix domain-containing protein [Acidobacteriota bacterium]